LVVLLDFFVWLCAIVKKANVPLNAMIGFKLI